MSYTFLTLGTIWFQYTCLVGPDLKFYLMVVINVTLTKHDVFVGKWYENKGLYVLNIINENPQSSLLTWFMINLNM